MSSVQVTLARRSALEHVLAVAAGPSALAPEPPAPDVRASELLAPDVRAWFASPEQGLAAQIESVDGATATTEALARLAPSTLTVCATVVASDGCWAELTRAGVTWGGDGDGDPEETCVVGLSYDDAGAVSRLVWLRAPLAPPAGSGVAGRPVPSADGNGATTASDGRPILERYLADLSQSRFGEAATHFTADTIYSHPPYGGGTERVLYRGRDALAHGFAHDRGPSPVRQVITGVWQRGGRMFVEGVIEGIPNGGTFFSTAQISPEGEIARYVAFYSATRIPAPAH
jgi:hypothetical protein